ncbi:MAG: DUF2793 domain-containing protein, partial [Roseovarius sp.]|nr:DUF2793 domain-containing protein [Roseovarius sp.]
GVEAPPVSPEAGSLFGLGAAPTGVWAAQAHKIAAWDGVAWQFFSPLDGWRLFDLASHRSYVFEAGTWKHEISNLSNLDGVGIRTSWDDVNRLAVASEATLLSHAGAGHQVKVNKAVNSDTASLLFQSGWTGHAEMGLAGDNAFSIKLSSDGNSWAEAVRMDPSLGEIAFSPAGSVRVRLDDTALQLDVPLTGTAAQTSAGDTTDGRVLKLNGTGGSFGLGGGGAVVSDFSSLPSHSHFIAGAGSGVTVDAPPDNGRYRPGVVAHRKSSDRSSVLQFTDSGLAVRNYTGGLPDTGWNTVFCQQNLLGPVSQSGGVPTGALQERGSNANGEYVRFADGTQICSITRDVPLTALPNGALFTDVSSFGVWVFPASFADSPNVFANLVASGDQWAQAGARNATQLATVVVHSTKSLSAKTRTISTTAIGRWF